MRSGTSMLRAFLASTQPPCVDLDLFLCVCVCRQNPYALEAALALTEIAATREFASSASAASSNPAGASAGDPLRQREIERFYAKVSTLRTANRSHPRNDAQWMQALMTAHLSARRGKHRRMFFIFFMFFLHRLLFLTDETLFVCFIEATESFEAVDKLFPNNLHCLLHRGKLDMDHELYHQAHLNFHKVFIYCATLP